MCRQGRPGRPRRRRLPSFRAGCRPDYNRISIRIDSYKSREARGGTSNPGNLGFGQTRDRVYLRLKVSGIPGPRVFPGPGFTRVAGPAYTWVWASATHVFGHVYKKPRRRDCPNTGPATTKVHDKRWTRVFLGSTTRAQLRTRNKTTYAMRTASGPLKSG